MDGGSNDVAVFNINSDASLTPITGSPWPSNGSSPSSLGLLDNALGNASANDRLKNSLGWTVVFALAASLFKWVGEPVTTAPVLVIDAAYVLALFFYRLRQESHW